MTYQFKNASILVIDDMQAMLSLTTSLLKIFGFADIYTAKDAEKGFEKFCRHDPDIVLTDWQMDPFDGTELVHKIRTDPASPNKFVPVIMMTGYSHKIRVEQARDKGVTEFLVKPFRAKDLYVRLEQLVEKPRRFVDSDEFFGPDRRRRKPKDFQGPFLRENDEFLEIARMEEDKASALLKSLKDEAKAAGTGNRKDDQARGKKK